MSTLKSRDDKGSYTGPRGDVYLKVFVCHGCQSCWRMSEDGESVIDTGPHFLSESEVVTDKVEVKL